jgi:hypothetical protein
MKMIDLRRYAASSFIGVDDIVASGPTRKTIVAITEGKYGKPDLTFSDGSKFGCNKGNARVLLQTYGARGDGCIGHVIELTVGDVEYQGRLQPSVIITPITKPDTAPVIEPLPPEPATIPDDDMGGDGIPY